MVKTLYKCLHDGGSSAHDSGVFWKAHIFCLCFYVVLHMLACFRTNNFPCLF